MKFELLATTILIIFYLIGLSLLSSGNGIAGQLVMLCSSVLFIALAIVIPSYLNRENFFTIIISRIRGNGNHDR